MNIKELSDEFDILYNNVTSNKAPGLDIYEKSVFLTMGQEAIVRSLYNGTLTGVSLEETEELRRSLDALITTDTLTAELSEHPAIDNRSEFFRLDNKVWFITYEAVELLDGYYCENNKTIEVIPVRQDEWHRIKNNPFKRPNRKRAVRLDNGGHIVEIVSDYPISKYIVRYLRKPTPIILGKLEEGLSIEGNHTEPSECELDPAIHRIILEKAVEIASKVYKT